MSKKSSGATSSVSTPAVSPESALRGTRASLVPVGTNLVLLRGTINRAPITRVLSSAVVVLSFDLAVRPVDERLEVVPVSWFDPPARACRLDADSDVCVIGRVRRRFFRAGGATTSRTEVVADTVVSSGASTQLRAAIAPLLEALAAFG